MNNKKYEIGFKIKKKTLRDINVLVGGCDGYIGSALCEILKKNRIKFTGFDSNIFKNCTLKNLKRKNKIIIKDVRDISENFLRKFNVYIHLPAISNNPADTAEGINHYKIVREYSLKIAKMCKKLNIKFIFSSSCSVYGKAEGKISHEKSKPNPVTYYAKNKLNVEKDLIKLSDSKFKPIILRISTLFGASRKMRFDLAVSMFLAMAYLRKKITLNSTGLAWRPHIYLDDVVKIIYKSIFYKNDKLEIINVGSDKNNYRMITVANKIKNLIPGIKIEKKLKLDKFDLIRDKTVKYGKDERNYRVSFKKIKKIFKGFKFISIDQALKKDLLFYKKIKLSKKMFNNKKFYRQHYMTDLLNKKKLNNNLRLTKK